MFNGILVAIDDSKPSARAVSAGASLGKVADGTVRIVHMFEHAIGRGASYDVELREEANAVVSKAVDEMRLEGLHPTGEVIDCESGHVAEALVKAAGQRSCDTIVIGTRGLSDVGSLLLGSVTHDLIRHFDGAVVVVR